MVQTTVVRVAAIFSSLADEDLASLPPLDAIDLTENVRAKDLHFASFGCDTHVGVGLAPTVRTGLASFCSIIGLSTAKHIFDF